MLSKYKLHDFNFNRDYSYIYILYHKYEIVYIGMTRNLDQRLFKHLREKRFDNAKYIIVSHEEAPIIEKELITYYKPLYNGTYAKSRKKPKSILGTVKKSKGLEDYIEEFSGRDHSLSELMWVSQTFSVPLKKVVDSVKTFIKP